MITSGSTLKRLTLFNYMKEHLIKLAKVLNSDNVVSKDDINTIFNGIVSILSAFKEDNINLNEDTKSRVNELLNEIIEKHETTINQCVTQGKNTSKEVVKQVNEIINDMLVRVEAIAEDIKAYKPKDGEDADEEVVASLVFERLKNEIPQQEVKPVTGEEIVNKINELDNDPSLKIDAKHIKNLPQVKQVPAGARYLNQLSDANIVSPENGQTIQYNATTGLWENVTPSGGSGSGDVTGPSSSVDNSIARFNGTTGKIIQGYTTGAPTISDTGAVNIRATSAGNTLVVDTNVLVVDSTNDRVGFGTASPEYSQHFVGSTAGGFVMIERTTSSITGGAGTLILQATCTADMNDTFGPQLSFNIEDNLGVANQIASMTAYRSGQDNTGAVQISTAIAGVVTGRVIIDGTTMKPVTNNGLALGTASYQFSDLFLAEGGVINFDNGDITITQTNNVLAIAGTTSVTFDGLVQTDTIQTSGSSGVAIKNSGGTTVLTVGPTNSTGSTFAGAVNFGGAVSPSTTDGAALGGTGNQWSDIFLASGAVINFNNGNYTFTHSAGAITASGSFSVGTSNAITAGTIELGNASDTTLSRSAAGVLAVEGVDVPTVSSTSTLTNKIIRHTVEPAADDTYTGEDLSGFNATGTIAQWEAVYLTTTGWALTDADATATAGGVMLGLAATAGTASNPLTVVLKGIVRNDGWTWATVGAPLYLSTTAGALTETAPSGTDDVQRIVGYVLSDDCIYWNPSNDYITRV